ncbi:hypothetical protein ES708_16741 [subsurface metagenome]
MGVESLIEWSNEPIGLRFSIDVDLGSFTAVSDPCSVTRQLLTLRTDTININTINERTTFRLCKCESSFPFEWIQIEDTGIQLRKKSINLLFSFISFFLVKSTTLLTWHIYA